MGQFFSTTAGGRGRGRGRGEEEGGEREEGGRGRGEEEGGERGDVKGKSDCNVAYPFSCRYVVVT